MSDVGSKVSTRLLALWVLAALAACGGGSDDVAVPTSSSTPSPSPSPSPSPPPAPGGAVTFHFSDCQTGAAAGCVPGNNANPGTEASPKQNLSAVNLNTLPAGTTLLLKRGGAWNVAVSLANMNVTPTAPLTIADYGTGALPVLNTPSGTTFSFGAFGTSVPDGGYTFRNLSLNGRGTGQWGAFIQGAVRNLVFEGVIFDGFDIGAHMQQAGGTVNQGISFTDSTFRNNREHGILGAASNLTLRNNLFTLNNPSGGGREHGVYLTGGGATNLVVVGNRFIRNSAPGGVCDGGNFTMHGQWTGALIEGNVVEQDRAVDGCYGFSITPGYSETEWFRNFVIRNNTVINVGVCAFCIGVADAPLIEGNKVYNTQANYQLGIWIGANEGAQSVGDDQSRNAIIRNNLICMVAPASGSAAVRVDGAPGVVQSGNTNVTGSAATSGVCAR